jgi:hypothetical protein
MGRGWRGLVGGAGVLAVSCASEVPESEPISFSLRVTVPAGAELHRCEFVRMPRSAEEIFVRGGRHDLSPGTHHYVVFRTTLTEVPPELQGQTDCSEHGGVMRYATSYVTGGQTPHENADFPAAAALPFRSEEILLLQGHFTNSSQEAVEAGVAVLFRTVPGDAVEHRAGLLRFYNPFISIAPHSRGSGHMRCPIAHDIVLLAASSHMHKHGIGYEAFLDVPGEAAASTPFYTTTTWQNPQAFLGYMPIEAGSLIRYRCDYDNGGEQRLVQGLSAETDEMCMFGGFYYPAMEPDDEICAGMDMHGSGTASCSDTFTCVEACPAESRPQFTESSAQVGECWQTCIAASCPNVTAALFPQLACMDEACAEDCAELDAAACRACAQAMCAAELDACEALACDG